MTAVDDRLGTLVDGRFEIVDVLGRGASGVVYRARQKALDRDVAIKVLDGRDAGDPELRERFKREAKTVASLRSDFTVGLHDFGRLEDGSFFIVMELVEGETLEAVLAEHSPLPVERCRRIFEQIAMSLAEAHDRGVVHRDVKPSNVMIQRSDGRARLLDFGISKTVQQRVQWTRQGDLLGTPPYMAPEQWAPELGAVGPATDIYALGVMLFEALTGTLPFRGETPAQWMKAHLEDSPHPLAANVEDRARFEPLLRDCLQKSPGARLGSASAFADCLRRPSPKSAPRRTATVRLAGVASLGVAVIVAVRLTMPGDDVVARSPRSSDIATIATSSAAKAAPRTERARTPPPKRARRRKGKLSVGERIGLDEPSARAVAERVRSNARPCLRTMRVDRLRVVISAQGLPTRVRSEPSSNELETCVLEALRSERFPPPSGNFAVVTIQVHR